LQGAEACEALSATPVLELALAWSAPADCPSRDTVVAEVRRLLGGKIDNPDNVSARAEITRRESYHLHLTLSVGGSERARDVEAPTCAALGDTAALIVALAIDPNAGDDLVDSQHSKPLPSLEESRGPAPLPTFSIPPPPPPESVVPPPPPPFSMPLTPSPPTPAKKSVPGRVQAHAGLASEQGAFGQPSVSGRAGAAFVRLPLRIELSGIFEWVGRIAAPQADGKGGSFWLVAAALAGCYERAPSGDSEGASTAAGCAGLEAGSVSASGFGILAPVERASPWVAPFVGAIGRWAFHPRVALRLDLSVFIPVVRADFRIDGVGLVHRTGVLGARGGAGLELTLGSF
jgi:hypothetical protein